MSRDRLAVFDLDGTLHHTEKALLPAIKMAMEDLGARPVSDERINSLYGEPLEVFCSELLGGSDDECRLFRQGIRKHQRTTLPVSGALYTGTVEMLDRASEDGWELGVLSNAGLDYIELVTGTLGIRGYFHLLRGRDGQASKTGRLSEMILSADAGITVMTGDRYHDIEAAKENGIPSIGCAYGYGSSEEIGRADHLALSPSDITTILRSIAKSVQSIDTVSGA